MKPKPYTQVQIDFLRKHRSSGVSLKKLTELFNDTFEQNRTLAAIHGACLRHSILSPIDTRFKNGIVAWNKGKKGYMGANKTSFKKGNIPHAHVPVGTESISQNGYITIKVAEPNVWKFKHKKIWEDAHGEIPENHVIRFKDGDKTNIKLENLELISRLENFYLNKNHYKNAPDEVKPIIRMVSKVETTLQLIKNR